MMDKDAADRIERLTTEVAQVQSELTKLKEQVEGKKKQIAAMPAQNDWPSPVDNGSAEKLFDMKALGAVFFLFLICGYTLAI